jgi:hypothetical protein
LECRAFGQLPGEEKHEEASSIAFNTKMGGVLSFITSDYSWIEEAKREKKNLCCQS